MDKPNIVVLCQAHSSSTVITAMYTKLGWNVENPEVRMFRYEHIRLAMIKKTFKTLGYDDELLDMMEKHELGSEKMHEFFTNIEKARGGKAMKKHFRNFLNRLNKPWIIKDPAFSFQCLPYFQDIFYELKLNPILVHINKDLKLIEGSCKREGHPRDMQTLMKNERCINKCYNYWQGPKLKIFLDDIKESVAAKNKYHFLQSMGIELFNISDEKIHEAWSLFDVTRDTPEHPLRGTGQY